MVMPRFAHDLAVAALLAALSAGCNVAAPPQSTGGSDAQTTACGAGLVVIETDYQTTNVALDALDGTTTSASFLSSGSKPPGLSLPLSGDVVVAGDVPPSGKVVLIDRFGTDVVTWADPKSGDVLAQLKVGTGFEANPQDYVEFDANTALVSRYGANPSPGKQANDAGEDVIVIDTSNAASPSIKGRIAMPVDAGVLPRPQGLTRILGGLVLVTLQEISDDFSKTGDAALVAVDPGAGDVAWRVDVPGMRECGRAVPSPSGKLLAVACTGSYDATTQDFAAAESDLVLFDATVAPIKEVRRLGLSTKVGSPLGPSVTWASESLLLAVAAGTPTTRTDVVYTYDLKTDDVVKVAESKGGGGIGSVRCSPGCGDVCLAADSDKAVLHRWHATAKSFDAMDDVKVEQTVGLPPRALYGY
jgi:hypothetical protein